MIDYAINVLEQNEIPTVNVELCFFKNCNLMLCVRFSWLQFENFKKVADLLSLAQIAYGYETPYVGSDVLGRWKEKEGKLENERVDLDCGARIDIQIDGETIILEFVGGASRVSQDFTFKQWLQFKKKLAKMKIPERAVLGSQQQETFVRGGKKFHQKESL